MEQRRQHPCEQLLLIAMGDCADVNHCVDAEPHRYLKRVSPLSNPEFADHLLAGLRADGLVKLVLDEDGEKRLQLQITPAWWEAAA
jgi:hypothetical protein